MVKKLFNKNFILLLQGNAISTIGDVMYSVAIGYWVYQTTGSSALMGIMSSISMFVTMFLSPFCGSIVDKCNRKGLIVAIDTIQGLIMLAVGILAYMNVLSVPIVLISAFLAAFGSVFYSPAISTIMLDIIPRDDMVRGQSITGAVSSLISLMGSAFSGVMVVFLGVPLIVIINGLSNLYSAFTELFVSVPKTAQQENAITVKSVLKDSFNAAKTIFTDKCLKVFVPCALILNLLAAGPLTLVLPFCMQKGFSVDAYGYIVAVYSIASLIAVLMLGTIKLKPRAQFWAMSLGFTLSIPCFILTYFSKSVLLACIFVFGASFLNCVGNSIFNASMTLALPEENRSAILGFLNSASVGGTAISTLIYGFLGDVFAIHIPFAIGSALAFPVMIFMCFHPNVKQFVLMDKDESCNQSID